MNTVVCLCGSTRFAAQFNEANRELSKRGLSVISISMCLPKTEQGSESDPALKELLDLVHLNKIMRSDAVFVVGDGYIGRSTAREILWAEMQGKPVIQQVEVHNWDNAAHCLKHGCFGTGVFPKARAALGGERGLEQSGFDYFECPECGFSSVQKSDFSGSGDCPVCAGDGVHQVPMNRRTACASDKPEGRDARKDRTP